MIGNLIKKENKVVEKALEKLPKYNCILCGTEKYEQTYTTEIEHYDGIIYVKLYYEGEIAWSSTDSLFIYATEVLNKIDYRFQGITHYRDNREICLTFLKKD